MEHDIVFSLDERIIRKSLKKSPQDREPPGRHFARAPEVESQILQPIIEEYQTGKLVPDKEYLQHVWEKRKPHEQGMASCFSREAPRRQKDLPDSCTGRCLIQNFARSFVQQILTIQDHVQRRFAEPGNTLTMLNVPIGKIASPRNYFARFDWLMMTLIIQ
jgi:hypothetical protein